MDKDSIKMENDFLRKLRNQILASCFTLAGSGILMGFLFIYTINKRVDDLQDNVKEVKADNKELRADFKNYLVQNYKD